MKHKRWIAGALAVSLCITILFATMMINFTLGYNNSFYSSFEDNEENTLLSNTTALDSQGNPRVSGLGMPIAATSATAADVTALTTAEGPTGHPSHPIKYINDNNTASKYLFAWNSFSADQRYVLYTLSEAKVVTSYSLTVGDDLPNRDPKNWVLYGSNDKSAWTVLDTRNGEVFAERKQTNTYSFANSTPFKYYKLLIKDRFGADTYLHIAEWRIFGYSALLGDITTDIMAVEGTASRNNREVIGNLDDSNSATKYLVTGATAEVIYTLNYPQAVAAYSLTSANDEPTRDPKAWTISGSNDKSQWTTLDTRSDISFASRYLTQSYTMVNTATYKYYKLSITTNGGAGMMQLADWNIATGIAPTAGLSTVPGKGPSGALSSFSNQGWSGSGALAVRSAQTDENAYGYNVIYKDLNLYVSEDTQLSYLIYPDYVGSDAVEDYDHEYTSMHVAVDLKFTDGSYLSNLNATDQNGDILSPKAQGESRALYTKQWNTISAKLGEVAKGKVIDQILVGFEKSGKESIKNLPILAYIDDLKIEEVAPKVYKNQLSYTMTRRGTQSSEKFSRGLTIPATAYPNGFNFWAPCTTSGGNMLYQYQPGNDITHITISHEASYWMQEYGTFQFMPNTSVDAGTATAIPTVAERKSDYDRDTFTDQANYLKIDFAATSAAGDTTLELVPTNHGATVKFTFDQDATYKNIIFDSVNATSNGQFTFNEDGSFQGRTAHSIGGMPYMYFYGTFSEVPSAKTVVNAASAQAMVAFPDDTKTVIMNLATSFISADQAKHNLELEIGSKTFKQVYADTEAAWLDIMDRIEIEGGTEEELITFWSNLYRAYLYPTTMAENRGTNESPEWVYASPYSDVANPTVKEGKLYYNNGFWDVARTTPGFYALLTPTAYGEYLDGFVEHYNESGWVGRWLAASARGTMVGTHSDAMFADAYLRGIDFDYETAYLSALRNGSAYSESSTYGRELIEYSNYLGYVNTTDIRQGFSWSMEAYINDAAIAKLAAARGDTDIATYYGNRALYYTKLFNEDADFFIGKNSSGGWYTSAESYDPAIWNRDYTETNGWNYAFHVPYDGQGLANLYGGEKALENKLDEFFGTDGEIVLGGERTSSSALIHEMVEQREVKLGEYGHSNQPSHHIIFMYNYANAPEKTQYYARDILDRLYVGSSIGQGYLGDEDNGEASCWYLQAALGFFPVNVGSGNYTITSPLFEKVTLHLENGNDLVIKANNNSRENVYIQSMTIDGKAYDSTVISHSDLINAGEIVFEMGSAPSNWGKTDGALDSITQGDEVAVPMEDSIPSNIVSSLPAKEAAEDALYISGTIADAAKLMDNNGGTYATISGNTASIYAYYKNKETLKMYTISNFDSTTNVPTGAVLYGSDDGSDWKELDRRADISFKWSRYVEPFAVENTTAYKYYRLDLSTDAASMEIAELEFYGYPTATKEELKAVIDAADAFDASQFAELVLADFKAALSEAKAVYANAQSSPKENYIAIQVLQAELDKLNNALENATSARSKLEAESCDSYSNLVIDKNASRSGGGNLGGVKPNSYACYDYLDFGTGASKITINYSRKDGADNGVVQSPDATIKVYLDALPANGGTLAGTISEPAYTATNWATYTDLETTLSQTVTGIHTVYLVFEGSGPCVVNLDYFQFS